MRNISQCFTAVKIEADRFQNSPFNKSHREREKKRHLCGPIAPGLQHVVWRLSNSNRSTFDHLESFERQLGQLWVCVLTRYVILRLPCVSIKPSAFFLASLSFNLHPFLLKGFFFFIWSLHRWRKWNLEKKVLFSIQIMMMQPSEVLFTFLRNNCSNHLQALHSPDNPVGEEGDKCLCSQACSCAGLLGTEFIRSIWAAGLTGT